MKTFIRQNLHLNINVRAGLKSRMLYNKYLLISYRKSLHN